MIPEDQHNGARATIREVTALVEQARRDVLAEVKLLETEIGAKLTVHATQHATERKERRGLLLWAVTTIMTGAGVLIALFVALRSP